jgi:hypothetical protein
VSFLRNVLRVYSWIYEAIISLMAVAIAAAAFLTGHERLYIPWLPWPVEKQSLWLIGLGVLGLILVLLAVARKARILLFIFSGYVAYVLVTGLFLNPNFPFGDGTGMRNAALVTLGGLLAVIGAWPTTPSSRAR